jgi:hypothetical protein
MADQLTVDTDRMRQVSRSLEEMRVELDLAEQVTRDYLSLVGSPLLAKRLEEFAGNWRIHRQKLSDELAGFSKWAGAAADAFNGLDAGLAKALADGAPKEGAK